MYGFNGLSGELLASSDGGTTWQRTEQLGALVDLAIDPSDGRRLLASSEDGLKLSEDGGGSWRSVARDIGRLAWAADGVYVFDGEGRVLRGSERGGFKPVGQLPEVPAAVVAGTEDSALYTALAEGELLSSSDGGRGWEELTAP